MCFAFYSLRSVNNSVFFQRIFYYENALSENSTIVAYENDYHLYQMTHLVICTYRRQKITGKTVLKGL